MESASPQTADLILAPLHTDGQSPLRTSWRFINHANRVSSIPTGADRAPKQVDREAVSIRPKPTIPVPALAGRSFSSLAALPMSQGKSPSSIARLVASLVCHGASSCLVVGPFPTLITRNRVMTQIAKTHKPERAPTFTKGISWGCMGTFESWNAVLGCNVLSRGLPPSHPVSAKKCQTLLDKVI